MDTAAQAQAGARLEALIAAVEALPEQARAPARELLAVVVDLHGTALRRIMDLLEQEPAAAGLVPRMVADEGVRAVLLIHGLHPHDLETRVQEALQDLEPRLGAYGLRAQATEVSPGAVRVAVSGAPHRTAPQSLKAEVHGALQAAAPDAAQIVVDGLEHAAVYIPVESLRRRAAPQARR